MDDILQVNERLRGLIWGAPMLILLLGTGLYFTAVTGVFQVRYCMLWLRKTLFSCFTGAARGRIACRSASIDWIFRHGLHGFHGEG